MRNKKWFEWFLGLWTLSYFISGFIFPEERPFLIQIFGAILAVVWMLQRDLRKYLG